MYQKFCEFGTELLSNTAVVENIGSRGVNDFLSGSKLRKSLTKMDKNPVNNEFLNKNLDTTPI